MIQRTFALPTGDGEEIRGDLRLPDDGDAPRSAVVVVHGFKGFRRWGFFPFLGEALAREGHAVVSFDFSRNGIGPDGESFTRLEAFAGNTFSREVREVGQVLAHLRTGGLLPVSPERIGLLGHSRGGGIAILAARDDEEAGAGLDALVTWAAVAEFGRWSEEQKVQWRTEGRIHAWNSRTGQQLPLGIGLLEDFEAHRDRLDILRAAAQLKAPWLIVHGEADATVPVEDARRLDRVHPSADLEIIPGAGHTFEARHPFDGSNEALDRVIARTVAHLGRHLGGRRDRTRGRP